MDPCTVRGKSRNGQGKRTGQGLKTMDAASLFKEATRGAQRSDNVRGWNKMEEVKRSDKGTRRRAAGQKQRRGAPPGQEHIGETVGELPRPWNFCRGRGVGRPRTERPVLDLKEEGNR
ncbi:hypothetical protein TRVL_07907 [Trypanosoma vivax]|nr:hypothetical protein TRVL_07907 [Trypanosoma vivax]